jgi:hypothetical protein
VIKNSKPIHPSDRENPWVDPEDSVILTVRQEIGRVALSPNGTMPVVEEAFRLAGQYINDQILRGISAQQEATVEFSFQGVEFTAGYRVG